MQLNKLIAIIDTFWRILDTTSEIAEKWNEGFDESDSQYYGLSSSSMYEAQRLSANNAALSRFRKAVFYRTLFYSAFHVDITESIVQSLYISTAE